MKTHLLQLITPQRLTFASACLVVVSMIFSPFLLSIGMWGLVGAALWQTAFVMRQNGQKVSILRVLGRSFQHFFAQRSLVALSLLFLIPAVSFFWSSDHDFWLERVVTRIPFFVLPWAFANLPRLTRFEHRSVLYLLVWTMVIFCIGVGINFALHLEPILDGLGHGRPVPVPRSHIRFNLMLATAILAGGWLWQQRFYLRFPQERRWLAVAVIFLFFFIHVLTVRSGIAALYTALFFSVARFIWRTQRWKIGLAALSLIVITPIVAYLTLPSLQERIGYMIFDWQQYKSNSGDDYSDAERWISLQAGLQLWQEHPLLGVGTGDLPAEIQRVVNVRFPNYTVEPKLPHNQFIYILSGTGLLGLLFSLVAFFSPIIIGPQRHFYLFAVFQVMVLLSFLVEYTVETSPGVAYYLFYTLFFRTMARVEFAEKEKARLAAITT